MEFPIPLGDRCLAWPKMRGQQPPARWGPGPIVINGVTWVAPINSLINKWVTGGYNPYKLWLHLQLGSAHLVDIFVKNQEALPVIKCANSLVSNQQNIPNWKSSSRFSEKNDGFPSQAAEFPLAQVGTPWRDSNMTNGFTPEGCKSHDK